MRGFVFIFLSMCYFPTLYCLDNSLALTPPMGWMHWERFRCLTDCVGYPDDCVSEKLFRTTADLMASGGYLEVGYEYVIVDDCWLAKQRNEHGKLQADPLRFPSGMKSLADYVHSKGLKFGIYADYGTYTCAGYPGSLNHLEVDAITFAEWGVDYLKLDGCYAELDTMVEGYREMSVYLNQTGRPIVFSCSFPAYQELEANYSAAVEICNLWRNYGDISDSWTDVKSIARWFATNQEYLTKFAGPGHWNDPDMLIIGNFGLSLEQSKAQMTIWSIMAAPLIMSVDLKTIRPEFREILLNKDAIRINQDPLGIPGRLHVTISKIAIWLKPLSPLNKLLPPSYALGFVSEREDGYPYRLSVTLQQFGLTDNHSYSLLDIFEQRTYAEVFNVTDPIVVRVKPTAGIRDSWKWNWKIVYHSTSEKVAHFLDLGHEPKASKVIHSNGNGNFSLVQSH